jgi:hypothetical protein
MLKPRPPAPEWCRHLYECTLIDGEWVVVFETEFEAKRGLLVIQSQRGVPPLHASPLPDHPFNWYVGEL